MLDGICKLNGVAVCLFCMVALTFIREVNQKIFIGYEKQLFFKSADVNVCNVFLQLYFGKGYNL